MERKFVNIKVGDHVIVFDEYSHDYIEHEIEIMLVENDIEYKTETNPTGIIAFGEDLTMWEEEEQDYLDDDYITLVHEGNFVCYKEVK